MTLKLVGEINIGITVDTALAANFCELLLGREVAWADVPMGNKSVNQKKNILRVGIFPTRCEGCRG